MNNHRMRTVGATRWSPVVTHGIEFFRRATGRSPLRTAGSGQSRNPPMVTGTECTVRSILIAAMMLACLSEGLAQSQARASEGTRRVEGRVTDQSGAALPRVSVQIRDKSGRLVADAQTNARGELAVDLSNGDYLVTATLAGFAPLRNQSLVVAPSAPPFRTRSA